MGRSFGYHAGLGAQGPCRGTCRRGRVPYVDSTLMSHGALASTPIYTCCQQDFKFSSASQQTRGSAQEVRRRLHGTPILPAPIAPRRAYAAAAAPCATRLDETPHAAGNLGVRGGMLWYTLEASGPRRGPFAVQSKQVTHGTTSRVRWKDPAVCLACLYVWVPFGGRECCKSFCDNAGAGLSAPSPAFTHQHADAAGTRGPTDMPAALSPVSLSHLGGYFIS